MDPGRNSKRKTVPPTQKGNKNKWEARYRMLWYSRLDTKRALLVDVVYGEKEKRLSGSVFY